jgi:ectoine hydroxylase-related dioxygenase (phytanoyl-CoA dioxygenase family)
MASTADGSFAEQGYLIARNLIPVDVVTRLRSYLERSLDAANHELQRLGIDIRSPGAVARIKTVMSDPNVPDTELTLRRTATGHYPLEVRLDRTLWAIAQAPTVQALLKSILGTDSLRMHMPPMARFILPGNDDAGVPAHQDIAYNTHMADFVTVWVPLVEIDEACGGVTVFPGSDKEVSPTTSMRHGVWLEGIDTSNWQPVDCIPMSPGDALLFKPTLVHRSMANRSDHIRFSMDCRFFGGEKTSKHYLDMDRWEVVAP